MSRRDRLERATTPIAGGTAALFIYLAAVLAAAFKNIKNRGNELKDLLTGQGITEITTSKRTQFGDCRGTACRPLAGAILHDPG